MPVTNFEFVEEFAAVSEDVLAKAMPDVVASVRRRLAERLVTAFLAEWGGCSVYIPRADALARHRRNRAILRDYDGTLASVNALAREHRLSAQQIYRIIAAAKKPQGATDNPRP